MEDIRWRQRFENLEKALHRLRQVVDAIKKERDNTIFQMACLPAFQFTFELSWKTMKDYLFYNGVQVAVPREVLKQAFHVQIVKDGQVWIDMLEDRNLMAHIYEEEKALAVIQRIEQHYLPAFEELYLDFKNK